MIDTTRYPIYQNLSVDTYKADIINALLTAYMFNPPETIKRLDWTIIFRAPDADYKLDLRTFDRRDLTLMRNMLKAIGKPLATAAKTNEEAQIEQQQTFNNYANEVLNESKMTEAFIFNRAWYGEYVYGCIYRDANPYMVLQMITDIENKLDNNETYLITLIADNAQFLVKNDDGLSLSNVDLMKLGAEKERFIKVHNHSKLKKKLITVNDGENFRPLEEIFSEIEDLIDNN